MATRCAAVLGTALVNQAMSVFDREATERAHSVAWRAGAPEFANQVARDANAAAIDLFQLGVQVQWLATVFPAMASGDDQPYLTSAPYFRAMLLDEVERLKVLMRTDPTTVEIAKPVFWRTMEGQERAIMFGTSLLARS